MFCVFEFVGVFIIFLSFYFLEELFLLCMHEKLLKNSMQ